MSPLEMVLRLLNLRITFLYQFTAVHEGTGQSGQHVQTQPHF